MYDFVELHHLALGTQRTAWTAADTGLASDAVLMINDDSLRTFRTDMRNAMVGTDLHTMLAVNTFFAVIRDLQFDRLRFRIGTPIAVQRTAFQKNSGSDSGSIVY
jgi:hypothetical protein